MGEGYLSEPYLHESSDAVDGREQDGRLHARLEAFFFPQHLVLDPERVGGYLAHQVHETLDGVDDELSAPTRQR